METADPAQVSFYCERARQAGSTVLELGCGGGLLAVALALEGLQVVGADPSEERIGEAVERRRALQIDPRHCRFERADLRSLRLQLKFGLVCAAANSLSGLTDLADLAAVFDTARSHLEPRGSFAFDIRLVGSGTPLPEPPPQDIYPRNRRAGPPHLVFRSDGNQVVRRLALLELSLAQVEEALRAAGLEPLEAWADFAGTPYSGDAERMVAVARGVGG